MLQEWFPAYDPSGYSDAALIRYNSDGTLDQTFNPTGQNSTFTFLGQVTRRNGKGILIIDGSNWNNYDDVVVQADGKILVVEHFGGFFSTISDLSLVRYNVDGSLDTTFGNGGQVQEDRVIYIVDEPNVLLQSDGKILVGHTYGSFATKFGLIRYNTDGSRDNSFGTGGSVNTSFSFLDILDLDLIALQNDGKIVAAGTRFISSTNIVNVIARYNADGTLDTSFGDGGGWTSWSYNAGATDSVKGLTIQADGKILMMSELKSGEVKLSRLNSNGSFDTTFKVGGSTGITGQGGNEETLSLQADGKILAVTEDSQGILITRISSNSNDVFFGSANYVVNEDGSAISSVTINRAGDLTKAFSVTVTPSNGTATNADYTNTPIVVNFLANETSKVITIPITNDSLVEGNETINLTLSNPTNEFNLVGQTTATLTITENDNGSPITLIVNTTSDEADGTSSGTGLSLRDAIITANNDTTHDYIIQLQGGQTYSLSIKNTAPVHQDGDEQAALRGDLDILGGGRITIKSVGTQKAIVDATNLKTNFASGFGDAAFDLKDNSQLILDGVTVTGASIAAVFIADTAIAEILNSTITNNVITVASAGNEANQYGGGIFNAGTLILKNSLISNNQAAGDGGGLWNAGAANIINSTISNNSSEQYGGGIFNAGIVTFTNSTISSNTAKQDGGGIYSNSFTSSTVTSKVYLNNSTITNNTADSDSTSDGTGGGIYNIDGAGEVYARNTIIAGNFHTPNNNGGGSGATYNSDISGTIYGNNNNLIGTLDGASGTIGTDTDIVNPNVQLSPLQNNGGLTLTHIPLSGNPAINAGNNNLIPVDSEDLDGDGDTTEQLPFDAQNLARISGGTVDIGAVEVQNPVVLPSITLAVSPASVLEDGIPNLVYTFTRTGDTTNALTVNYSITGTADAIDYTGATPGTGKTITFVANSVTATLTIDPTADTTIEADETVALTLDPGTDYTIGTTSAVTGTITNDDVVVNSGVISFSNSQFSVNEDGTPITQVTLTRTGGSTGAVSATLNLTDGTAWAGGTPNDYNNAPITVNFSDGETSKTVIIPITDDNLIETSETINLTLVDPTNGATIGTQNNAILTIVDNETSTGSLISQNLPVANYTASSTWTGYIFLGGPETAFDDSLSTGWNSGGFPIQWIEVDLGKEYALNTIQLRTGQYPDGNTTHEIWVSNQPIAWSVNGVLAETIQGYTTSGQWLRDDFGNTTIGRYVQIKTVASPSWVDWVNIEVYGEPVQTTSSAISFSNSQFSVNEDGTAINQVTLTRTEGSIGEVIVTLNLTDGTATAGSDYNNSPITATFADGETSKTVTIPIVNDTRFETDETVNLILSNPQGGAILGTQTTATLTILNDDLPQPGAISLNSSSYTVNENGTPSINLIRTGGSDGEVSATLNLTDGTATAGNDYIQTPITVTFADGETSKTVNLSQASQGLSFDGNSYVNVGNRASLVASNVITIEAWINPNGDGVSTLGGGGILVNKEGEYEVARYADGTIRWAFANTDPTWLFIDTGYVVPLNQWNHIAITYDSGLVKTYANGILVHNYNGSGTIADVHLDKNDFQIGGRQQESQFFQGSIDDVRIWNKARTQAEIQADFNRELTGNETGLVGYWNFNSVNGNIVQDLTSNHNDGTLVEAQSTTGFSTSLIIDDNIYEPTETVNLTLSNPTGGATLGTQQTATLNIVDNDTPPPPPPSLLQVRVNLLKDNGGNVGDIINNDQIGLYQSFFVEILVGDFRDNAVGVNGLQLDFNWDGFILESINVPFDPSNIITPQLPLLQGGTLDNPNGLIDDLSGGSLPSFELGQAIGINQLDRFALLYFYAENITDGTSYLTTAVDSVSLSDDASYVLDVETAQPLEVLSTYSQYTFTYHYGNGDYYSGYGYALADTYTLGQILSGYANETGNLGYYTIDSISPSTFDSSYNGQVYVTSYTDADTNYGYGTTTNIVGNTGYSGLGSESGNAYTAEGNAYDSFFSNDAEADLVIPTISITDNSGNATDASIRFTTELSKFRKNYQDSNFVRPNYADSSKYFDITNTGTGKLTISELRINVAGVSSDLNLTQGDLLLNPNESQRVKLTYAPSAAKEILERSDALVLVTNAINSPELAITLSGKSTFNSDVNYDGKVGVDDLGSLNQGKANLKKGIYDPTADITGDGLFNNLDVAMLQSENKLSLFA